MKKWFSILWMFLALAGQGAAVLPPEKLLPKDTIFVVTYPNAARARGIFTNAPIGRLWRDPALKAFRDKFTGRFMSDVLEPMEREFGIKFSDYADLAQGQVTLAVIPNEATSNTNDHFAGLLLLDTKDHSDQLKKNLADVVKKWTDSGKKSKTEKIRDVDFTTLITTPGEMSNAMAHIFPGNTNKTENADEDAGDEKDKKANEKVEITFGQADSLLIVGTSAGAIEKVLSRQAGGLIPALEEYPQFQTDFAARLKGAPFYIWFNAKTAIDLVLKSIPAMAGNAENPLSSKAMKPDKALAAMGLTALTSVSFVYRDVPEGMMSQFFIGVPESGRRGLIKALAAETRDANPPPFVPADAVKFSRWRLNIPKTWTTIEGMLNEINPTVGGLVSMVLSLAGKDKDSKYDLKAELLGNLGNDIISYEKNPRSGTDGATNSSPSLFLIGSPNADKLAAALKVGLGGAGGTSKDREFLGRKIIMTEFSGKGGISFSASGGYVAISSDEAMLEEYLRNSDNKPKSLSEMPGLNEAAQKVGGMGLGLFGFSNDSESMKSALEDMRKNPGGLAEALQAAGMMGKLNSPDQIKRLNEWVDTSLLPPFEAISSYFYFEVYAGSFNADGFQMNFFSPTPPKMK